MRADLDIFIDGEANKRFAPSLVAAESAVVLSKEGYQSEHADLVSRDGSP